MSEAVQNSSDDNEPEKCLVWLYQYYVSARDIGELNGEQVAALGMVSYACSEISTMFRLYCCSMRNPEEHEPIAGALFSQQILIVRMLSAKILELSEFLTFEKRGRTAKDETVRRLGSRALSAYESIRSGDGYGIARYLRNKITNHYDMDFIRNGLEGMSTGPGHMDFDLYSMDGKNIWYHPFGDDFVFSSAIYNWARSHGEGLSALEVYRLWIGWVIVAVEWSRLVHGIFVDELITSRFPDRSWVKYPEVLDNRIVRKAEDVRLPIILARNIVP